MHNVYNKNGEFFTELRRIITEQGFILNEKKTGTSSSVCGKNKGT